MLHTPKWGNQGVFDTYPLETLVILKQKKPSRRHLKFSTLNIGSRLDLAFELTQEEVDEMMAITRGEFKGTEKGLQVNLTVTRLNDALLVQGRISAGLALTCVRCLSERERFMKVGLDVVLFPEPGAATEREVELTTEDMNVSFFDPNAEELDLTDLIREALLLELPAYPSCDEDEVCQPYELPKDEEDELDSIDPRWRGLMALKTAMAEDEKKRGNE